MFYVTQEPLSVPSYNSYPLSIYTEFEVDTTFINVPHDATLYNPPIVYIIHISFTVVSAMVLTNLLVAMLGETHTVMAQEREELWRTQVPAIKTIRGRGALCFRGLHLYSKQNPPKQEAAKSQVLD